MNVRWAPFTDKRALQSVAHHVWLAYFWIFDAFTFCSCIYNQTLVWGICCCCLHTLNLGLYYYQSNSSICAMRVWSTDVASRSPMPKRYQYTMRAYTLRGVQHKSVASRYRKRHVQNSIIHSIHLSAANSLPVRHITGPPYGSDGNRWATEVHR